MDNYSSIWYSIPREKRMELTLNEILPMLPSSVLDTIWQDCRLDDYDPLMPMIILAAKGESNKRRNTFHGL